MDLRNQLPGDTFQYIVTTDGNHLYTGTGSLITSLVITDITSSHVTQSFVSESFVTANTLTADIITASNTFFTNSTINNLTASTVDISGLFVNALGQLSVQNGGLFDNNLFYAATFGNAVNIKGADAAIQITDRTNTSNVWQLYANNDWLRIWNNSNQIEHFVMNYVTGKVGLNILTGSVVNQLDVNGNISCSVITASIFNGTVVSSSYAGTASVLLGSITSASYAQTASFALNGVGSGTTLVTASTYPITSSWANTASVYLGSVTSASFSNNSLSSSYLSGSAGIVLIESPWYNASSTDYNTIDVSSDGTGYFQFGRNDQSGTEAIMTISDAFTHKYSFRPDSFFQVSLDAATTTFDIDSKGANASTEITFVSYVAPTLYLNEIVDGSGTHDVNIKVDGARGINSDPTNRKGRSLIISAEPNVNNTGSGGNVVLVAGYGDTGFHSGSVILSGSVTATDNVIAKSFTGSLSGTASWSQTASVLLGSITSASYASFASTASFALNAGGGSGTTLFTGSTYQITSSWAQTASCIFPDQSYTIIPTNSLNWITTSFNNSNQQVNLTTAAAYNFTSSNRPGTGQVSDILLYISHSANATSSLSFPSSWNNIGSGWPTSIIANTVGVLWLRAIDTDKVIGTFNYSGSVSSTTSASYSLSASYATNGGSGGTILTTGSTYPITSSWSNNTISSSYALSASSLSTTNSIYCSAFVLTGSYSNTQTSSYTLLSSDAGKFIIMNNTSSMTVTVPVNLNQAFACSILQYNAGKVAVTGSGGVIILNRSSQTGSFAQYSIISLIQVDTTHYILQGDTG